MLHWPINWSSYQSCCYATRLSLAEKKTWTETCNISIYFGFFSRLFSWLFIGSCYYGQWWTYFWDYARCFTDGKVLHRGISCDIYIFIFDTDCDDGWDYFYLRLGLGSSNDWNSLLSGFNVLMELCRLSSKLHLLNPAIVFGFQV